MSKNEDVSSGFPQTAPELEAAIRFRDEVCSRGDEVDPNGDYDWLDLSIGFFLACKISPERAVELASWVRYTMQYWEDE